MKHASKEDRKKILLQMLRKNLGLKQKFKNILYKVAKDYHIYNQWAIKVVWDKKFEQPVKIEHIPSRLLRVKADSNLNVVGFVYQDDWVRPTIKKEYKPFDLSNKKDKEQVLFYFEDRLDLAYSILIAERKENEVSDTPISTDGESEPQPTKTTKKRK